MHLGLFTLKEHMFYEELSNDKRKPKVFFQFPHQANMYSVSDQCR